MTHPSDRRLWKALGALWLLCSAGPVLAQTFDLPAEGDSVVGRAHQVIARHEDTLLDIGRRYHMGYQEIRLANPGMDAWMPGEGASVVIPDRFILPDAPRDGIVLNLAELRVYYYPKSRRGKPRQVITYPVSVGRMDWKTPLGTTSVVRKVKGPAWNPPETIRREHAAQGDILPERVPPGPDNPLGAYALYLGRRGYLIHGTNKPAGIGMRVTHGCVRLYPEDVERLYHQVPVGTPVHIVDQPYKVGWSDGVLYLEVHPPLGEAWEDDSGDLTPLVRQIVEATAAHPGYPVDWGEVERAAKAVSGIPVPIRAAASGVPGGETADPVYGWSGSGF